MDDSMYSGFLPMLGRAVDGYRLSGAVNRQIPCLRAFIRFAEALERFLLLSWQTESAKTMEKQDVTDMRLTRLRNDMRRPKGVVTAYHCFAEELRAFTNGKPGFCDDAWQSLLCLQLTVADFFPVSAPRPPLFDYLIYLAQINPGELFKRFLTFGGVGDSSFADTALDGVTDFIKGPFSAAFETYFSNWDADQLWLKLTALRTAHTGGDLVRYCAFEPVWTKKGITPVGIATHALQQVHPLYGLDDSYRQLQENMRLFVAGAAYRHVMLWGYRGTGKSSCVIRLAGEFFEQGVRLMDYPVSKMADINQCFDMLGRYREKFILFLDDLSFEKNDTGYILLKTKLEGSIKRQTGNIILLATSNRRELVDPAITVNDERTDAGHIFDEKRAIDDRFGLKLFFDVPVFDRLKQLLFQVAEEYGIDAESDRLFNDFKTYCMMNRLHSPGGRAVRQFLGHRKASASASEA